MTVAELIAKLGEFDPALHVVVGSDDESQVYVGHPIEVELWTREGQTYVVVAA